MPSRKEIRETHLQRLVEIAPPLVACPRAKEATDIWLMKEGFLRSGLKVDLALIVSQSDSGEIHPGLQARIPIQPAQVDQKYLGFDFNGRPQAVMDNGPYAVAVRFPGSYIGPWSEVTSQHASHYSHLQRYKVRSSIGLFARVGLKGKQSPIALNNFDSFHKQEAVVEAPPVKTKGGDFICVINAFQTVPRQPHWYGNGVPSVVIATHRDRALSFPDSPKGQLLQVLVCRGDEYWMDSVPIDESQWREEAATRRTFAPQEIIADFHVALLPSQ